MLKLMVGATRIYDESTERFGEQGGFELQLEHSLVSLSKWEADHEKPFLAKGVKSRDEVLDYVRCMVVTPNPPGDFLQKLSKENLEAINVYIDRKMTATWFSEIKPEPKNQETVTSELVYYWMTLYNIPFECETWHLNRLFTLIRIATIKSGKPKKMSRAEVAARNKEINARRKKELGTKG